MASDGADSVRQRAVQSFYADYQSDASAPRLCRGLSCHLAGPAPAGWTGRPVQCLGYCDRAPARLRADGAVDLTDGTPPGSLPDIRCRSAEAVVTARIGRGDHSALDRARTAGVYGTLLGALTGTPEAILAAVEASGEQGRGGAGFPTGRKWRLSAATPAPARYVVANGDEGDPGSFVDRVLLEHDPHGVLEGLALCAFAVGAREGIVYIRSEYPAARVAMEAAIAAAREAGLLGPDIAGSGFTFEARVVSGHGSYVCGEETALLNAIEGRRGEVRIRPPYPAVTGLHGLPTVVNNIETLVNIPWIVARGPAAYRRLGTPGSPGTKAFCFNRGFARPGIVEAGFGVTLRDLIEGEAGSARPGTTLAAVALGGPMGSVLLPAEWDVAVDYPELTRAGLRLGHGGFVAIPAGSDWGDLLRHWLEFMAGESCGKCVPCRHGSARALALARALAGRTGDPIAIHQELASLLDLVARTSLCGFGQSLPAPIERLRQLAREQGP